MKKTELIETVEALASALEIEIDVSGMKVDELQELLDDLQAKSEEQKAGSEETESGSEETESGSEETESGSEETESGSEEQREYIVCDDCVILSARGRIKEGGKLTAADVNGQSSIDLLLKKGVIR